jgi:hypothetical protein
VRVLEGEEWWGCWRGVGAESAGEGGVVGVLQREEWWGCCRGRSGGGAAEGGVVRVLEGEECPPPPMPRPRPGRDWAERGHRTYIHATCGVGWVWSGGSNLAPRPLPLDSMASSTNWHRTAGLASSFPSPCAAKGCKTRRKNTQKVAKRAPWIKSASVLGRTSAAVRSTATVGSR